MATAPIRRLGSPRLLCWARAAGVVAFLAFLAPLCWRMYTAHNDFPIHYHPDEPSKAMQVLTQDRNFLHPLLLLQVTSEAARLQGVEMPIARRGWNEDLVQQVGQTGRNVAAGFAVVAVLALALTAYFQGGLLAMIAVGLVVAFSHTLLIYAHYFKEDTALIMGLSLTVLSLTLLWKTGSPLAVALLGVSCGLAASGKYVGLLVLTVAVPLLLLVPRRLAGLSEGNGEDEAARRAVGAVVQSVKSAWLLILLITAWVLWSMQLSEALPAVLRAGVLLLVWPRRWMPVDALARFPQFVLWLAATILMVNWPVMEKWQTFRSSFDYEASHAVSGHTGVTASVPNWYWSHEIWRDVRWPVAALAAACVLWMVLAPVWRWIAGRWTVTLDRAALVLVPGVYFTALFWCVLPFNRYVLPVMVFGHVLAGMGVAVLAGGATWWLRGRPLARGVVSVLIVAALLAGVLAVQAPLCGNYLEQLRDDSRLQLRRWIEGGGLPAGSRLATDAYVGLEDGKPLQSPDGQNLGVNFVRTRGYLSNWGSVEVLRKNARATHVIVCDLAYDRYFNEWFKPVDDDNQAEYRRRFYEDVFAQGELVWEVNPPVKTGSYTNPRLRVFRIAERPERKPKAEPAGSP